MQSLITTQQLTSQTRTFGVENAWVNLEQTLPSAAHHIPSISVLQEKVTPCCDHLVLTYRIRAHFSIHQSF